MVNDPGNPFDDGTDDGFDDGFDDAQGPDLGDWVSDLFDAHDDGAPLDLGLDDDPLLEATGPDDDVAGDLAVDDLAVDGLADVADVADEDDEHPDVGSAGHADAGADPDRIELPLDDPGVDGVDVGDGPDLDPTGVEWPAEHTGLVGLSALDHVLGVSGLDLDPLIEAADRLGVGDELDLGLDGRTASVLLEELGVDAITAYGDLDDLGLRVDRGDEVLIGGRDGSTLRIVDVDDHRVIAQVLGGGDQVELDIDGFEAIWADAAYEMVVVDPAAAADPGTISLTSPITLVQVTVETGADR